MINYWVNQFHVKICVLYFFLISHNISDAWEFKYHDQRSKAIRRLKMLCAKAVHL